jgi:sarcosine oxidase
VCYVEAPEHHRALWESSPAIVTVGDGSGYTLPPLASTGLKFGHGSHRRPGSPDAGFDWNLAEGEQVIDAFRPILRDADAYRPLRLKVGYYVMNAGRRFVVRQTDRCLFITNCDGQMFKFGPLIGEKVLAAFAGAMSSAQLSHWATGGN